MIAYVETVNEPINITSKTSNKQHDILKFILNNNDGCRIQCNIWNADVPIFKNEIQINEVLYSLLTFFLNKFLIFHINYKIFILQVILLQNVTAQQKSNFNNGNMDYELHLKKFTVIKKLGNYDFKKKIRNLSVISFEDLKMENGYISKLYYNLFKYIIYNF